MSDSEQSSKDRGEEDKVVVDEVRFCSFERCSCGGLARAASKGPNEFGSLKQSLRP